MNQVRIRSVFGLDTKGIETPSCGKERQLITKGIETPAVIHSKGFEPPHRIVYKGDRNPADFDTQQGDRNPGNALDTEQGDRNPAKGSETPDGFKTLQGDRTPLVSSWF